ncbi:uncharacterized protein LOC111347007 isoform X2 [Stylophora pistillata]|uniref:uncharacterized protein LOC111347007 isoform X2 n=1 Tax=Stylophora pistillata TaxID=50429 RepID=UPI000C051A86|nr:uncharacterized protein LOC111347007 isoform X2 [Stylophora pistillata]
MASAREENRISTYRKLLIDLSMELSRKDLEMLIYAVGDFLPRRVTENMDSGLKLFEALEHDVHISPLDLTLLQDGLNTIGRVDLAQRIQVFSSKLETVETDGGQEDIVTDEIGDQGNAGTTESDEIDPTNTVNSSARKGGQDDIVTDGIGDQGNAGTAESDEIDPTNTVNPGARKARAAHLKSALLPHHSALLFDGNLEITPTMVRTRDTGEATSKKHCLVASGDATSAAINNGPCTSSPAPSAAHVGQQSRGPTQAASSGRVQNHLAHGTAPVRYVNFLVYEGYSVEVIGGKHFKTPDGEFVEMKSGTQYKIHVKNSHPYGCHLDISMDGFDVGGWALLEGEEMLIERSAYEAKKFTFYRVKTAPKEAGIVSGRAENGVLKCMFTPEVMAEVQGNFSGPSATATAGDVDHNAQDRGKERELEEQEWFESHGVERWSCSRASSSTCNEFVAQGSEPANVVEPDPAWRAGATTLQGDSTQQFVAAEPMTVDPSRKVELVLRLVAREGEEVLEFPKDECKPLSTLTPPAVQE